MKAKTLLLALVVLFVAVAAFAADQYTIKNETVILRQICDDANAAAIPDQSTPLDLTKGVVWVYEDLNGNGCDWQPSNVGWATWVPGAAIGADALPAITGSGATFRANWNRFQMDGVAGLGTAGLFTTEGIIGTWNLAGSTANLGIHSNFYLVVTYSSTTTGAVAWITDPIHIPYTSTPTPYIWGSTALPWTPNWRCITRVSAVPPCVQTADVTFDGYIHAPQDPIQPPHTACATICPNSSTPFTICVGPLADNTRRPRVTVTSGCQTCDPQSSCVGAQGFIFNGGFNDGWVWTTKPTGNYYCKTITWGTGTNVGGCVCIKFEAILPVSFGTAELTPMDNAVKMSWNTHSETALDKFIVLRDNAKIAEVRATNGTSEHTYSYTDEAAANGTTYNYSLVMHHSDGTEEVVFTSAATPSLMSAVVTEYALRQNYPNPFNPTTNIIYDVKDNNFVTLKVYNATGQEVSTLVNGAKEGGHRYSVTFDASNLPSGLYFYSIKIGNEFNSTKKMLLVK